MVLCIVFLNIPDANASGYKYLTPMVLNLLNELLIKWCWRKRIFYLFKRSVSNEMFVVKGVSP